MSQGSDWLCEMDEQRVFRGAAESHGLIRVDDALAAGVNHEAVSLRVRRGRLERVHRGVCGVVGAPMTWRRALLGAIWAAGPDAVASHLSAAALWRLDGFDESPIQIAVPNRVARRVTAARVRRVTPLDEQDRTAIDGIPVTGVERTVIDLAGALPIGRLAHALDSAIVQRLTTPERIGIRLHKVGRRGRKGAGRLAALLEERVGGKRPAESRFEGRLERVLLAAGLPRPVRQYEISDSRGRIGRVDFAYPRVRLAIEADSYRWHAGYGAWERDLRRRTRLAAAGWRVVHCSWKELSRDPRRITDAVRAALSPDV